MKLPRDKKQLVWLGLAVLLLVYAGFSVETAPSFLACVKEPEEIGAKILAHGRCGWRILYGYRDAITAAAAVLLVIFAWTIFRANRQMARQAEDAAQRQSRAYVMVSKNHVELEVGQLPRFRITLKNFGQTPAFDVVQWSNVRFDFYPGSADFDWSIRDDEPARGPLGPGAKLHTYPVRSRPLTAHEMAELEAGDVALYVIGTVTYRDVFGEGRVTQYCLFVGGPVGAGESMVPYHEGNYAN